MNVKSIAETAVHSLGAVDFLRYRNRSRARILMYHRFHGDPNTVRERLAFQCRHLRRHYHPVGLDEIADAARDGKPLPPNSLALTIDDGYRDFQLAFPIFREFGFRPTLYVVSQFASGNIWLWPDQLLYLLENSPRKDPNLPVRAAFDRKAQGMIAMSNRDRLSVLRALPTEFDASLPSSIPERFAPLSWPELRAMVSQGLDIGAHTASHPILSKLDSEDELYDEIAGSKAAIESATGASVSHFCYPNGTFADIDAATERIAAKAGYRTAVLAEPGFAGPPYSPFRLKRIGVDPGLPQLYFERCVAGYRL
jgi:peptidoglycan/xylan/chitin deacetylase (PgdA/CDA1 family)